MTYGDGMVVDVVTIGIVAVPSSSWLALSAVKMTSLDLADILDMLDVGVIFGIDDDPILWFDFHSVLIDVGMASYSD